MLTEDAFHPRHVLNEGSGQHMTVFVLLLTGALAACAP